MPRDHRHDEFLHRVSEVRRPQHPPPIRYEYSKGQYVAATHPCSHCMSDSTRITGAGQEVSNWSRLRSFYFSVILLGFLDARGTDKEWRKPANLGQVLKVARAECRLLYQEEFSNGEGERFHVV